MPASSGKSAMFEGLMDQFSKGHDEFKKSELKGANAGLPPGINRGTARLVEVKIGEYAEGKDIKGKPYVYMSAKVVEPVVFKGQRIWGRTTKFGPEPLCDTPSRTGDNSRKTFAQHLQYIENAIGLLIGKDAVDAWDEGLSSDDPSRGGTILANFLDCMDKLGKRARGETDETPIYFIFNTFQPKKVVLGELHNNRWGLFDEDENGKLTRNRNVTEWHTKDMAEKANRYAGSDPRVFEVWGLAVDGYTEKQPDFAKTQDDTGAAEEAPRANVSSGSNGTSVSKADPNPDGAISEEYVKNLLAEAEEKNEEAGEKLKALAGTVGMNEEAVDAAASWKDVADYILASVSGVLPGDKEEEVTTTTPKVGDGVKYVVIDSKTGKPVTDPKTKKPRPAVDCLVKSVSVKNRVVELQSMVDPKVTYKNVPWDRLSD